MHALFPIIKITAPRRRLKTHPAAALRTYFRRGAAGVLARLHEPASVAVNAVLFIVAAFVVIGQLR